MALLPLIFLPISKFIVKKLVFVLCHRCAYICIVGEGALEKALQLSGSESLQVTLEDGIYLLRLHRIIYQCALILDGLRLVSLTHTSVNNTGNIR